MKTIGFIGIGVMGRNMAGHLLTAGHPLCVHSRTPSKAAELVERGARWADSPAELAPQCEVIFTIVGFPRDVEEVYWGPRGLIPHVKPGTILVDMTTSRPDLAVRIAEQARTKGCWALDAPVSGGEKGAREATLTFMVGGDASALEQVRPLLQVMGKTIVHHGPPGSGQHCKLCNQIAIAGTLLGVCESLAYAKRAGLALPKVLESLSSGAAASWTLSHLAPRMLSGDFAPGFYVKHFLKDMTIAAESAEAMALDIPALNLALSLYHRLNEQGGGDLGTQALYKLYK